jgi:hypothetical protein
MPTGLRFHPAELSESGHSAHDPVKECHGDITTTTAFDISERHCRLVVLANVLTQARLGKMATRENDEDYFGFDRS